MAELLIASLAGPALGLAAEALIPKPDRPTAPIPAQLPDRSAFANQLLTSAFSPQSDLLNLATQTAQGSLGRQLGRAGLTGSGFAGQQQAQLTAALANKFLENELQRRAQAFSTVTGAERGEADLQNRFAQQAFENAMTGFGIEAAERANMIRGLTGLGTAAGGFFQQQASADRALAERAKDRELLAGIFRGVPG